MTNAKRQSLKQRFRGTALGNMMKPRAGRSRAGNFAVLLLLLGVAAFMLLPLIYIVSNAFKPLDELFVFPPRFFVINPTLDNFRTLSTLSEDAVVPIARYFINTLIIAVAVIVGHILLCTYTAYVLEKRTFPGRDLIFSIVVLSLMFSSTVTAIPQYLIISSLGLLDTYLAIIIPYLGGTLGLYLMKQFMGGIPESLLESARLDGASEPRIVFTIVTPLVKPAWLTLIILDLQAVWGLTATDVIFSEELKPLNYAVGQLVSGGLARAGASAALTLLMMLVPLAGFVFSQSRMLQTMASSGMKE